MNVMKNTDKKCPRCQGRGIGQWGSIYGECYRCGGDGIKRVTDVEASRASFVESLARYRAEGEAAKAILEAGVGDRLTLFNAKRHLEDARKYYGWILIEQRAFEAQLSKKGNRLGTSR